MSYRDKLHEALLLINEAIDDEKLPEEIDTELRHIGMRLQNLSGFNDKPTPKVEVRINLLYVVLGILSIITILYIIFR
jgi:hypothetical protein